MTPDEIKRIRQKLGLTQEVMAAELGVSFPTLNRWENGKVEPSPMGVSKLRAFAFKHKNRIKHTVL